MRGVIPPSLLFCMTRLVKPQGHLHVYVTIQYELYEREVRMSVQHSGTKLIPNVQLGTAFYISSV